MYIKDLKAQTFFWWPDELYKHKNPQPHYGEIGITISVCIRIIGHQYLINKHGYK
jgi:hypothetical protein